MAFLSKREKRLWLAAGLCTLLIYSSLYIARPAADYLRERNLLRLAVSLAFLATGSLIAWRLAVSRAGWRVLGTVLVVGAGYLLLLTTVPRMPEERMHFLEYGVVAAFVYLALRQRRNSISSSGRDSVDLLALLPSSVSAIVITAIVGWIDEGIQAVLPNRHYDLRDVAFNALAALVSVVSIKLVEWARAGE